MHVYEFSARMMQAHAFPKCGCCGIAVELQRLLMLSLALRAQEHALFPDADLTKRRFQPAETLKVTCHDLALPRPRPTSPYLALPRPTSPYLALPRPTSPMLPVTMLPPMSQAQIPTFPGYLLLAQRDANSSVSLGEVQSPWAETNITKRLCDESSSCQLFSDLTLLALKPDPSRMSYLSMARCGGAAPGINISDGCTTGTPHCYFQCLVAPEDSSRLIASLTICQLNRSRRRATGWLGALVS